jgi:hypothetical protein
MEHLFFYAAISFILMHEMDAIRCKEWRIFPGISLLREETGFMIFMLAHLPLYWLLFWILLGSENTEGIIRGLDIFFIIHLGLHLLFLMHRKNEFKDGLSWSIILGAAICGVLDLYGV